MSVGSAIFKVFASLVWGVGTFYILSRVRVEGASGGWTELLLALGLLGLLQGFSFVSFIMSVFNRGAEESANTIEETIWFDRFGNEVRRETDAGSGCLFAVILWIVGILLTLLASALIAPLIFVVNLCRAAHRFAPTAVAIVLDLLIIGGTFAGTVVGFGIADKAIAEREARRNQEAAQYRRESEAKAAEARAEREAQQERDRQAREARQQREKAEYEAQEAQRQAEREAKKQLRLQERAQREAEMQQKKALQQVERERKAAEAALRRAQQQAEREQHNAVRRQNRNLPKPRREKRPRLPF